MLLLAAPAAAVEIRVDKGAGCSTTGSTCGRGANPPCCRIQLAICNAVSGDLIRVNPGSYNESIRMKPGVSVVSDQGPSVTTIDGTGRNCNSLTSTDYCSENLGATNCSVVLINSPVGSNTRLEGFTISGGKGVRVSFSPNPAKNMGGGIFVSGSPLITNNVIQGNHIAGSELLWYGGGIAVVGISGINTPQITNNTITGNTAKPPAGDGSNTTVAQGGGLYLGYKSKPTVERNTISNNEAGDRALVSGAQTEGSGGGVFAFSNKNNGATLITRNLITGNRSRNFGAGVTVDSYCLTYCPHSSITLSNNEIRGNDVGYTSTVGKGGGIYTEFASNKIVNNTIHGNQAAIGGGHHRANLATNGSDVVEDINNIYSNNTARNSGVAGGIETVISCHTIKNCDFWQNSPQQLGGACSDSIIGTNGNIQQNPLYVNAAANDFHLDPSSLLIDAGTNTGAPTQDREGTLRPLDGNMDGTAVTDIGQYEHAPDCDGDGTPNHLDSDDDNDGDPDTTDCAPCDPNRYTGRAEVCNGIDDDCDGTVDEGFGQTTCGVGACQRTVNDCQGGVPQTCTPGAPSPEICNGIDDNCNGITDDDADTDSDGTYNCFDNDDDGDGWDDGVDCAPLVNSVHSAPGPVGNTLRFDSLTQFSWKRVAQSNVYNIYRGTITGGAWAYNHSCHESQSTDQSSTDAALPPAGQAYYYVISSKNRCGESAPGNDHAGAPRPISTPCATSLVSDADLDTVPDIDDNCPLIQNASQADLDLDTIGDPCDADRDNDGAENAVDCAPSDPTAFGVPAEVTGVTVSGAQPTDVGWTLQDIGSGTGYDLATGALSAARAGNFGAGTCLQNNAATSPYTDTRPAPAAGEGYYYLVRAQNACATATYGSPGRDQHGTSGGSACP